MKWLHKYSSILLRYFKINKTSLHYLNWKEVFVFIFFVLLSFSFWLIISLKKEYEKTIDVPIHYSNIRPDITFDSKLPDKISILISDQGEKLVNYSLNKDIKGIVFNDKALDTINHKLSISNIELESLISQRLLATTKLTNFFPQSINIHYNKKEHKDVPIIFNGYIQFAPGYQQSGEIQTSPKIIRIFASAKRLKDIDKIRTRPLEIKNAKETITTTTPLEHIDGVTLDAYEVALIVPVEEFTEKTIEVPLTCLDIPSGYKLRTFPSSVKVTCDIPLSHFDELNPSDLSIDLSFYTLEKNYNGRIAIKLTKAPSWLHNIKLAPKNIEFILEQTKQ